jgi:hypothetical protein
MNINAANSDFVLHSIVALSMIAGAAVSEAQTSFSRPRRKAGCQGPPFFMLPAHARRSGDRGRILRDL